MMTRLSPLSPGCRQAVFRPSLRRISTCRSGRFWPTPAWTPALGLAISTGAAFAAFVFLSSPESVSAEAAARKQPSALLVPPSKPDRTADRPGVHVWGDNSLGVASPDSAEKLVKSPSRIPFFDNLFLRDLKLGAGFGVAIDHDGDLHMWGKAFSDSTAPEPVFRGGKLTSIAVSSDRVIALSASTGRVYSFPVSQKAQQTPPPAGVVVERASWWSWLSCRFSPSLPASLNARLIEPAGLGRGEKVVSISSGLYHLLLLTNRGRVFSSASSTQQYPSHGQMGIADLSWETRPAGPLDQPFEITALADRRITDIATGDFHSLVRDSAGVVLAFGDHSNGQLGIEADNGAVPSSSVPVEVRFGKHYDRLGRRSNVSRIAAGGLNSFFVVESTPAGRLSDSTLDSKQARGYNFRTIDLWAAGNGVTGSLGTNRWVHVQTPSVLVTALSGLFEYSDRTGRFFPLPVSAISVGSTHVAAVVDPADTTTDAAAARRWLSPTALPATQADLMMFGGNEFWQLGTGKRANLPVPSFVPPLDRDDGEALQSVRPARRLTLALRETSQVKGKKRRVGQRVEAGRGTTAVFWAVEDE